MTRRILAVDDDESIRTVVELALELSGTWQIETAGSGPEALSRLASGELPDAVLLDVMMPDMDGLAVLEHLKADARTKDVPVVLLTGRAYESDRQRYKDLGATGIIEKPFDPMLLSDLLTKTLDWTS